MALHNATTWDAEAVPLRLLASIGARNRRGGKSPTSNRKLRLFAVACARRVWDNLSEDTRRSVDRAERHLDDGDDAELLSPVQYFETAGLEATRRGGTELSERMIGLAVGLEDAAKAAEECSTFASLLAAARRSDEWAEQANLLRCVVGNPFRPVVFNSTWRMPTAVAVAEGLHADRDWSRLPVLADALEDAGCDAADLLAHLRGPGPHARGCWPVDLVLGKS